MRISVIEVETIGFGHLKDGEHLREAIGVVRGPGRPRRNGLLSEDQWVAVAPRSVYCLRPYSFRKPADKEVLYGFAVQEIGIANGLLSSSVRFDLRVVDGPAPGADRGLPLRDPDGGIAWHNADQRSIVEAVESLLGVAEPPPDNLGVNTHLFSRDLANRPREHGQIQSAEALGNDRSQSFRGLVLDTPMEDSVAGASFLATVETALGAVEIAFAVGTLPEDAFGPHNEYLKLVVAPAGGEALDPSLHAALTDEVANAAETLNSHIWLLDWAEELTEDLARQAEGLMEGSYGVAQQNERLIKALRIERQLSEHAYTGWTLRPAQLSAPSVLSSVENRLGLSERWSRQRLRADHISAVVGQVPSEGPSAPDEPVAPVAREGWELLNHNPFRQIRYHLFFEPAKGRLQRRDDDDSRRRARFDRSVVARWRKTFDRLAEEQAERIQDEELDALTNRRARPADGDVSSRGTRRIVLHPFQNRYALFEEISASIGVTTFLTTASVLFLGVFLSGNGNGSAALFSLTIIELFVASFGFLVATLGYGNASGTLARHGTVKFDDQIEQANAVSEYFGVYPLMLGIPTAVLASATTQHNRAAILCVSFLSIVAMAAYHYVPGMSLLERDMSDDTVGSDRLRKLAFVPFLLLSMFGVLAPSVIHVLGEHALSSAHDGDPLSTLASVFTYGSCIAYFACMLFAYLCAESSHEKPDPNTYLVHEWDMLSEETPDYFVGSDSEPGSRRAHRRRTRR